MRALCFDGTLALNPNHPDPTAGSGECLVRVSHAGICATDLHIIRGYMNFTGVLGHEMVGTVERGSEKWRGKRVACEINCVCRRCDMCQSGLANHCRDRTVLGILGRDGCFADYVTVPERNLHEIPSAVSDEQAVFIEPLAAAYQVLKQISIESNMRVSVLGSGKLGLLVAQVLSATGCKLDVIGRNPQTLVVAEKLRIQPYHVDDIMFKQDRDVVVECTGSPQGLAMAMKLVRPRGTIILKTTHAPQDYQNNNEEAAQNPLDLSPIVVNEVTLLGSRCGPFPEAIQALARGAIDIEPMVTRTYDLTDAIEAIETAGKPGALKVLLRIGR